jgi:hypothetical protein
VPLAPCRRGLCAPRVLDLLTLLAKPRRLGILAGRDKVRESELLDESEVVHIGPQLGRVSSSSSPPTLLNLKKDHNMRVAMKAILTAIIGASLCLDASAATQCSKTVGAGAGRWDDTLKPSDRLQSMCENHDTKYVANAGTMVLEFNGQVDCIAASAYAANQESWHGNWFLWNDIVCENLKMHIF